MKRPSHPPLLRPEDKQEKYSKFPDPSPPP
jgi:hypothetical protein